MPTERTALITGASSGFGLLTTVALGRRGWRVLATMRDLARREKLESAAQAACVLDRIEFHALDVTNAAQIAALAATIASHPSPLHALINNAGFAMAGFAEEVSDAESRLQFETNFFGAAAVTRAFLPQFRRQGAGHIVMISSISGRSGFPGVGSYSASKFALEGWSETLRLELKPLGIQVVLVEPGSFETDIWTRNAQISSRTQDALSDAQSPNAARIAKWRSHIETGKPRANPQQVADGIAAILGNPHPKLRYVFGRNAKMAVLLRRLLPWSVFERILIKASGVA
ncbi:MAG TPA: SDR family oxidoreductase [Terracidiphilus sp.]|jgi:NAD(P)-dependent dehydrogenase (short-subunit alcohol dehydrogenase family)